MNLLQKDRQGRAENMTALIGKSTTKSAGLVVIWSFARSLQNRAR